MGTRLDKNSTAVRKRIEQHTFEDEEGDEYGQSAFGGFPEYFRRKKIKLQNLDAQLRAESADKPRIFRGIVAHVNGYTQPSLNDLHKLVVAYGGAFMQYLDGKTSVTHIICSNLTPKKVIEFRRYRIVKPAWIVDSVSAGKLLPWNEYRVLNEGPTQKVLGFDGGNVVSQAGAKSKGYREQSDTSWYAAQLAKVSSPHVLEDEHEKHSDTESVLDVGHTTDTVDEDEHPDNFITASLEEELSRDLESSNSTYKKSQDAVAPEVEPESAKGIEVEVNLIKLPSPDLKRKAEAANDSPSKRAKTAEEHNAILLADPRIRKSSVLNPEFLDQYYRESRLHHLSAWKADLKAQLQAQTAEQSASQKALQKRALGARRYVLHVDFDSFFVAVSLKNFPQYVDKPACVAHGPGPNSEIASCNYPARALGLKNGMWMKHAQEKCSDLKVLPYDFPAYEAASRLFYEAILGTGGIVQSVSIDEALVDITSLCLSSGGTNGAGIREGSIWREQAKADEIAQNLRTLVKDKTGCNVSVGIGGNILLAKVALRRAKPAGQYHVKPDDAVEFLASLDVQDLPGVAYSLGAKLEELGVKFVRDLRDVSRERLVTALGPKTGEKLWNYARGIDRTEVGDQVIRKSVSAEVNWGVRFETQDQADEFVESLCGELHRRLVKERVRGRHLTLKVMLRAADAPLDPPKHLGHGKCDVYNKSVALGVATNAREVIAKEVMAVFRGWAFSPGELRGLGVQMTKLEAAAADSAASQPRLQFKPQPLAAAVLPGPLPAALPAAAAASASELPEAASTSAEKAEQDAPPGDMTAPAAATANETWPRPPGQGHLRFKPLSQKAEEPAKEADPIDDPKTPSKQKSARLVSNGAHIDSPGRSLLNTAGTQFLLPTQIDPSVLAELPADIRSKLVKHAKPAVKPVKAVTPAEQLRPPPGTVLPNHSQLDPDILDALPDDVRAEILEHYAQSPSKTRGQSVLPQSPRKSRIAPARKPIRGKGRTSFLARLKGDKPGTSSTLTQANFVAHTVRAGSHDLVEDGTGSEADIAPDFLDALPEDIRREVMAEQRARQLKRTAGLELGKRVGARRPAQDAPKLDVGEIVTGEDILGDGNNRILVLPPRPARPTFTAKRLSTLADLRAAIDQWHAAFAADGPYNEDVEALGKFLASVVADECDMAKAVAVVRWLRYRLEAEGGAKETGEASQAGTARPAWSKALDTTRAAVLAAVKARGLGAPDL